MILRKLRERLLLKSATAQTPESLKQLELRLQKPVTFYLGIDPTANFLHLGHFMQLMAAKWMMTHKHNCIIVLGEFTALIGDPSGKTKERQTLPISQVSDNTNKLESLIKTIDSNSSSLISDDRAFHILRNNWNDMNLLDFFHLGKSFSLSTMLSRDCVKSRIEKGISYTEFSYMIFQANDFLHLYKKYNCTIQLGGSDQYGNILSGINIIRNINSSDTVPIHGITLNLLTDKNHQKIGKSMISASKRGQAVISDNYNDAVYMYNYLLNIPDSNVVQMVLKLSHLPENSTKQQLADFVVDCCWKGFPSKFIRKLLNTLYYPETVSNEEAEELLKNKQVSSFIVEVTGTNTLSTDLIADTFDIVRKVAKQAIQSGNSIKMFDLNSRKWSTLKERKLVSESIPGFCVIQYGTNIPFLLKQK